MGKKLFILFFLVMFVSCVSSRMAKYPGFNYSPTNPSDLHIYHIPPPGSFEVIGEVEGEGGMISYKIALSNMKNKAARIGGDAIVIIERREKYYGTYNSPSKANAFISGNYIYYTYSPGTSTQLKRKHFIGVVIKWKEE